MKESKRRYWEVIFKSKAHEWGCNDVLTYPQDCVCEPAVCCEMAIFWELGESLRNDPDHILLANLVFASKVLSLCGDASACEVDKCIDDFLREENHEE